MALARATTHTTAADGTFSVLGATEWNRAHTMAITGAISGGIPYFDSTTTEGTSALLAATSVVIGGGAGAAPFTSANLTYSDTLLNSGPGLKIGTTGANSGWVLGYGGGGSYSAMYVSSATISGSTYSLLAVGTGSLYINAASLLSFNLGGGEKMNIVSTAGAGPSITAGTATTNVAAESITQTWNNAACATGWKLAITDTTSAAGALAWQILGGASATTALGSLTKAGKFEAVAYRVNGTDGASFGPGLPTSITIVNGIVTAAS